MITDSETSIETVSIAALALGMVFVGSASDACVESILQALMTRSEIELTQPFARFLSVALGLLFLGKQDAADATLEVELPICNKVCSLVTTVLSFTSSRIRSRGEKHFESRVLAISSDRKTAGGGLTREWLQ